MASKQNRSVTTPDPSVDDELADLVQTGMSDPRVAQGLNAFYAAHDLVPNPVVTYAPVTYSTSGNTLG
jgi:hypothetical protein